MTGAVFIDTNVTLYCIDHRNPAKRERACRWLEQLGAGGTGRLSWQVVHEFYWNAVRKLGVGAATAREMVGELLLWGPVGASDGLVRRAWQWCDTAQLAYWDALIVAAAERSGARYLLTEDLQSGREFEGVLVVDPFGEAGSALLDTLS
ncbi:MAG: PIN domain-containing protein [Terriglobales bacterium]